MSHDFGPYRPDLLPNAILNYLDAHYRTHDIDMAAAAFTEDAVVVDEGATHKGRAEIRTWLGRSASEYSYTVDMVAQASGAEGDWVVLNHIEGNFPGGQADLRLEFLIRGDQIASLTIAP